MTLTLLHSKMLDVSDLLLLTFRNCVLKTGIIRWPLKLFVHFFYVFFKIQKKHYFLRFFRSCTRFLEHCARCIMYRGDFFCICPFYRWGCRHSVFGSSVHMCVYVHVCMLRQMLSMTVLQILQILLVFV